MSVVRNSDVGRQVAKDSRFAAASTENDPLFTARVAYKRAASVRHDADLQVDQLRRLIDHLEHESAPRSAEVTPRK